MLNASLRCLAEEECPDAQLCQEGQCECFWRDGLTGDACDEWTARAVWHITGRALSVAIYFAAGLHTARVLSEAISYEWRRSRSIINGCTPSRTLGTLASCLLETLCHNSLRLDGLPEHYLSARQRRLAAASALQVAGRR